MSAEDPVITVSNETFEPKRVDSVALTPSKHLAAKDDASVTPDFSSAGPVTELPAETVQASGDTLSNLLKQDANIPNTTPTLLNGSANRAETTTFVSVELLNFLFFLRYALEG